MSLLLSFVFPKFVKDTKMVSPFLNIKTSYKLKNRTITKHVEGIIKIEVWEGGKIEPET